MCEPLLRRSSAVHNRANRRSPSLPWRTAHERLRLTTSWDANGVSFRLTQRDVRQVAPISGAAARELLDSGAVSHLFVGEFEAPALLESEDQIAVYLVDVAKEDVSDLGFADDGYAARSDPATYQEMVYGNCTDGELCLEGFSEPLPCSALKACRGGRVVLLPRIDLYPEPGVYPFEWCRRQFPVRPAFAMTINKAQGQTLTRVGVYLERPCFSHLTNTSARSC